MKNFFARICFSITITRPLLLLLLLLPSMDIIAPVYASFGQSCSLLPTTDSTSYLAQDTAYGYVQQIMDMKTYVQDACLAKGNELKFCIKNQDGAPKICNEVTMRIGDTALLGDITPNMDIKNQPSLSAIRLNIAVIANNVCLTMPTSRGVMPILCRDHQQNSDNTDDAARICKNIGLACRSDQNKSQSLLNFSGRTIDCLQDTFNQVFYVGNLCPTTTTQDNHLTILRSFPQFQANLKLAVTAALTLYVMVFGFKIVMNKEYLQLEKVAMFLLQFIFVAYFAIGFSSRNIANNQIVQHNGMTDLVLPTLVTMTNNFTQYVFSAAGSRGLCSFAPDKYQSGYEFYELWDAIDCRIGYYLGMRVLQDMSPVLKSLHKMTESVVGTKINWGPQGKDGTAALNDDGFGLSFFTLMYGFLMGGNIVVVFMGIIFVCVVISVLLYFLTVYLVCTTTLYVMAYIAPIFVPMLLFERTKPYFDSWLKIVISCVLQPVVIGGFIALLLTMYDSAIYGSCEFQRYDYASNDQRFSTFELRLPATDTEHCESSVGYKFTKYSLAQGWEKKISMLFEITKISDYLDITTSLLYVILYVVIFYFFIKSVNEFTSDLVGGPSIAQVTVHPTAVIDTIKDKAKAALDALGSGQNTKLIPKQEDKGNNSKNNNNHGNKGAADRTIAGNAKNSK